MTIYVSHSTSFDFKKDLYLPLRNSELNKKHNFILPHENSSQQYPTKEFFQSGKCDLVIAECSFPSTGQGIELGWADYLKIPIVCVNYSGQKVSGAIKVITTRILEYDSKEKLIKIIELIIKNI